MLLPTGRLHVVSLGWHYTLDDFRQKWLVVIREPAIQIGRVALPMMMTGRSATFCRAS
jgi:hypothetical protein